MNDLKNRMQIYVVAKHMGNVAKKVKPYPFVLSRAPRTFRELIEEAVRSCFRAYTDRAACAKNPTPLSDEQWDGMQEIGKLAFGVHYNDCTMDESQAVETAMAAVTDGLVCVFRGDEELTEPDQAIRISEGDVFTFVRLTMLSGRMW